MVIRSIFRPMTDRLKYHFSLPTARAITLLVAALLLYFFGNQTQVGWMYVMSALLAGVVLAAWLLNRRALCGIEIGREVGESPNAELYEGDCATVRLAFRNAGRLFVSHVRTAERCPLVAPDERYLSNASTALAGWPSDESRSWPRATRATADCSLCGYFAMSCS